MKYAEQHMAMNLLRWHTSRKAAKRRNYNAAGTKRAQALLRKMGEVKK
jgi:hypothetical protein